MFDLNFSLKSLKQVFANNYFTSTYLISIMFKLLEEDIILEMGKQRLRNICKNFNVMRNCLSGVKSRILLYYL